MTEAASPVASVTRSRAPVFGSLSTFDRAIGDAAPLSVVTVESSSGIAAPGGLQIELSGVKALDVIVSDVAGGDGAAKPPNTARPSRLARTVQ